MIYVVIISSVFRKKAYTNVLLNFTACAPNKWKIGLIMCMLNIAKSISSSECVFNVEVSKLRIFRKKGYFFSQ